MRGRNFGGGLRAPHANFAAARAIILLRERLRPRSRRARHPRSNARRQFPANTSNRAWRRGMAIRSTGGARRTVKSTICTHFTAAHRTLPFNAVVRVTNLRNGKQTEVRITDRGPFVANRVIDLSYSAAQAIDMVGPGTAPVRLEMMSGPNPQIGFFGVQVGAFQSQDNAERFRAQLAARYL